MPWSEMDLLSSDECLSRCVVDLEMSKPRSDSNHWLWIDPDYNQEQRMLIYKYSIHIILALITEYLKFPVLEIKKIRRRMGRQ